jgi:trk system potassium uptake protein TrkH
MTLQTHRKRSAIKIDRRSVSRVLGYLLIIEFGILLLPAAVCRIYGESDWWHFLVAGGGAGVAGALLLLAGGGAAPLNIGRREGYLVTSLIWILFSLFGMLPFMWGSNAVLPVADAFFETMSGFTTTGATVIADVESLTHGLLFWRSLIQWVGGLGIVIFMLAVLPALNQAGGVPMFNAETTGITHDKLHPRIRQTAESLWKVYALLTALLTVLLWAGPMNLFDAICQAMTTMSTGGFSTRNASIAAWDSAYVGWVVTVFMLIGGVNFTLVYTALKGNLRPMLKNDIFRAYVGIVVVYYVLFAASLLAEGSVKGVGETLLAPLFQIATAITTTGFSYAPYEKWGAFAIMLTWLLMLTGACAGSTTGAIKVDRLTALWKNLRREVELTLYPRHIKTIEINGRPVSSEQMQKVSAFLFIYLMLLVAGTLCMAACGYTVFDSAFASASCIGNNGLGYGATGAAGGFYTLPGWLKWVFSLLMMIGRLEIFTVLTLFSRQFHTR